MRTHLGPAPTASGPSEQEACGHVQARLTAILPLGASVSPAQASQALRQPRKKPGTQTHLYWHLVSNTPVSPPTRGEKTMSTVFS